MSLFYFDTIEIANFYCFSAEEILFLHSYEAVNSVIFFAFDRKPRVGRWNNEFHKVLRVIRNIDWFPNPPSCKRKMTPRHREEELAQTRRNIAWMMGGNPSSSSYCFVLLTVVWMTATGVFRHHCFHAESSTMICRTCGSVVRKKFALSQPIRRANAALYSQGRNLEL